MCDCSQLIHGTVGLAKAVLGVDRADEETIQRRRAICRACPHAIPCPLLANQKCRCALCGCLLSAKTVLAGETCPDMPKKW